MTRPDLATFVQIMRVQQSRSAATYYAEVSRTPTIDDPEEEKKLLRRWQRRGDVAARDSIVKTHLKFVVLQACKRSKDPEAQQDYIAAGNLGLLKAADKFDTTRKPYIRFLTYAGWWVYEEMSTQDYSSLTVHVPAHRQKEQRRKAREYRAAVQERGPEAVAHMDPGLPEGVVVPIENARDKAVDHSYGADGSRISSLDAESVRSRVRESISRLPPREQTVLNLYFGMKDESRNLVQIANMMGMCPERVRQIKINGMQLLHADLKNRSGLSIEDAYL